MQLKYFDSATGRWIHDKPEARAEIYTRVYREQVVPCVQPKPCSKPGRCLTLVLYNQVLESEAGQARLAAWRAVIPEHKARGSDLTIVVKDKDGPRRAEDKAESWCEYTPAVHSEKLQNLQHSFGHGYLVLDALRGIGAAEGMCVDRA